MRLQWTNGSTEDPDASLRSCVRSAGFFPSLKKIPFQCWSSAIESFRPASSSYVLHLSAFLKFFLGHSAEICKATGQQLFEKHLTGAKILSYACQTVLSLAFFIDATKEMGTNYQSLQLAVFIKVPEDRIPNWFFNKMSVVCGGNTGSSIELGVFFMLEWFIGQS